MQYTGLYLEKHLKLQHFIISVLISILIKPVSVHTHTHKCVMEVFINAVTVL